MYVMTHKRPAAGLKDSTYQPNRRRCLWEMSGIPACQWCWRWTTPGDDTVWSGTESTPCVPCNMLQTHNAKTTNSVGRMFHCYVIAVTNWIQVLGNTELSLLLQHCQAATISDDCINHKTNAYWKWYWYQNWMDGFYWQVVMICTLICFF